MVTSPPDYLNFQIQSISRARWSEYTQRRHKQFMYFNEDPTIYQKYTYPYIQQIKDRSKKYVKNNVLDIYWVYEILDGKMSQDDILMVDKDPKTGFVLFDQRKYRYGEDDLLMLAILVRRDWHSVRSFCGLEARVCMEKIKKAGIEVMRDKFGLNESQYRAYIEYLPSPLHVIVHFISVPSPSIFAK